VNLVAFKENYDNVELVLEIICLFVFGRWREKEQKESTTAKVTDESKKSD
jgi:hypothetical protein